MKLLEVKLKTNKKTPYVAIKVSITGLYQKKQTIDFEELTNAFILIFWSSWFWKIFCLKPLVLFYT
jgi:hypothetical protein